jgi:hypothetical protein
MLMVRSLLSKQLEDKIILSCAFEIRYSAEARNRLLNYATRHYKLNDIYLVADVENALANVSKLCQRINKLYTPAQRKAEKDVGVVSSSRLTMKQVLVANVVPRPISSLLDENDDKPLDIPPDSEAKSILEVITPTNNRTNTPMAPLSLYVMELTKLEEPDVVLDAILLYVF